MASRALLRSKITKIDGHHFRFSIRGMEGDFDVPIPGVEAAPKGPSPKEAVLAAMCACTGTDVIDLLAKFKISYAELTVEAKAELTERHPKVFARVDVVYDVKGVEGDSEMVKEAVKRSTHQYSGVTFMVSRICPVYYSIKANGALIEKGQADFSNPSGR